MKDVVLEANSAWCQATFGRAHAARPIGCDRLAALHDNQAGHGWSLLQTVTRSVLIFVDGDIVPRLAANVVRMNFKTMCREFRHRQEFFDRYSDDFTIILFFG